MAGTILDAVLHYLRRASRDDEAARLSDRQLLHRFARDHDQDAFAALVCRHGPLVLGACRRKLGHHQDAEDAFQATFLVLAKKASVLDWQESVASWLYEVACRVSSEVKKKSARLRARETPMDPLPEVAATTEALCELQGVLDDELARLPQKYRAPLVLCCLQGRTRDEAAEQLGWTLGMVKGRLERGRELLRKRLGRRGVSLPLALGPLLLALGRAEAAVPAVLAQDTAALAGSFAAGGLSAVPAAQLAETVLHGVLLGRAKILGLAVLLLSAGALAGVLALSPPPDEAGLIRRDPDTAPELVALPGPVTVRHDGAVRAIAFLPDGRRAVSAGFDGTLRLWDVETGAELRQWEVAGRNSAVAVAPDGSLLAGGTAFGEVLVWDLADGKEKFWRQTGQGNVYHLAFSPDGKTLVSANNDGTVTLWDPSGARAPRHLFGHQGRVWTAAFSPDGALLASGGEDGTVRLWDGRTGEHRQTLSGHDGHVSCLAFAPDGRRLASSGKERTLDPHEPAPPAPHDAVILWDVATGAEVRRLPAPYTDGLAFAPDGRTLASCDGLKQVHLWDLASGRKRQTLSGHASQVHGVAFSPDGGRLAACGEEGVVCFWALRAGR